jgi:phosphoglucosamine mutase
LLFSGLGWEMAKKQHVKLFGTDGVRGHANIAPMTVENALALGRAAGKIFRRHMGKHRVVIGKDTRLSCYMFENALVAGLCSMGVDTLMVGPLPTPGVAFITRAYRADAGIVISASHNPYYDNGIKFFSSEGYKLPDSVEHEIESIVARNDFSEDLPTDHAIGKNTKIDDASGRYIEFVKSTFPKNLNLKSLRIALDCANGAAYRVAPLVFQELDAKVYSYGKDPNGLNINEACGALYPESVQKAVIDHRADVGIALDGDGDRVVLVDETGNIVDGDTILAICALDLKRKGLLQNNKLIATVMSNFGLVEAMKKHGIKVEQSQVGDRHVIEKMLLEGANLGGEQSGHIIFSDYNATGDGLVSALQVLRIMIEQGKSLSELTKVMRPYPQVLISQRVNAKPPLETIPELQDRIGTIEKEIAGKGRVLIRYSGTENVCRIMVEGKVRNQVKAWSQSLADVVQQKIGV